ncbi:MAG TPA: fatty acyl-AMP ligase [Azospirillum sp.]
MKPATASADACVYTIPDTLSIVEALAVRAERHPDRMLFRFLDARGDEEESVTCAELWRRVRVLARRFDGLGEPGERVALFYNAGLDFIAAYLGCLLAGRIAVPLNLPTRRRVDRCVRILDDCGCRHAATTGALLASLDDTLRGARAIAWTDTDFARDLAASAAWNGPLPPSDDGIAFLQYTSGSTSHPKGVMVTNHNLTTNLRMMRQGWKLDHRSTAVCWQPHHHDMGLILGQLLPIVTGFETVLMAPNTLVQRPLVWLHAISRYRAAFGGGPNFAYELCLQRFAPERLEGLDLSSWTVALNGAEVVRATTLDRFQEAYGPYGFAPEAMVPCYGLAEATLFVSGGPVGERHRRREVDVAALETLRTVRPAPAGGARTVVGCGRPSDEVAVAIVDPDTGVRRGPDEVGEIWIAGATNAAGYWRLPEVTERTFRATIAGEGDAVHLRTGDLGFLGRDDGQLYICGRLKDLIIVDGRNIHPEDIEHTIVECSPAIKPSGVAVFENDGGRVVAVVEVDRDLARTLPTVGEALSRAIRQAVSTEHGVALADVLFVGPSTMRKTTSGKIQRGLMRGLYAAGELAPVGRAVPVAV